MKHSILFVDDENNILNALRRLLKKSPYNLFFASSGKEALECLKNNNISVLVSDMRMPVMNGVELVKEANKLSPLTIKIILSGYSDLNDIMDAINSGHVHNYITKPWNESELVISLMNASELYERKIKEKMLMEQLNEKNRQLAELNSMLEKRVRERTWELNANNLILNSIIGGKDPKSIYIRIAGLISKISGSKAVSIFTDYDSKFYGSNFLKKESPVVEKSVKKQKPTLINNILVLPLMNDEERLGTVFIKNVRNNETVFIKRLDSLLSLLRMYISQQHFLTNSNRMMGSIDMILGSMDDETT